MSAFKIPSYKNILIFVGLFSVIFFLLPHISLAVTHLTGTPGSSWTDSATNGLLNLLNSFVLTLFGWLVGITGLFFDFALTDFVIGFGNNYNTTGIGIAIDSLWGTVRDIFNLTFIFGLVYIGFQMILGSNTSAQRSLGYLIAAALLVNFSLFITKFVVDFSNMATSQIYNAFQNPGGLTYAFANLMGISSIFNISNVDFTEFTGWGALAYIFGTMIIFMVLAFVYAAGAVMLTIRYVVLNIYLVASPIMFLGWVFPQMAGQSKKYWKGFLGQAFFAPAYVFMLYLSFRVLQGYNGAQSGNNSLVSLFKNGVNGGGANEVTGGAVIAYIALTIVFLLASLVVAKNMGATGASSAISIGQNLRKRGQGILYRNTGGRMAKGALNLMDRADARLARDEAGDVNRSWVNRNLGRGLLRGVARTAVGSKTTRGSVNAAYEYGAGGTSLAQNRKDYKEQNARAANTSAALALNLSITTGINANPGTPEQIAFEQAITNASQVQLIEQLRKHKPGSVAHNKIIQAMSHSQVTKVLESKDDEFNTAEKEGLASARGGQVEARLIANNPSLAIGISKANTDDLVALGYDRLLSNAEHISATRMDDLKNKLAPTEYSNLDTERTDKMVALLGTAPATLYAGKKDSDIARLPKTVLTDPRIFMGLNQRVLEIILRENYLNATERSTLKTNITTMGGPGHPMVAWLSTPIGLAF